MIPFPSSGFSALQTRPKYHTFSLYVIHFAIVTVAENQVSLRSVTYILWRLQEVLDIDVPSQETVRIWMFRVGLFVLKDALRLTMARIWILDHTVQLGRDKCLVILGVSVAHLEQHGFPLQHQDVQVLDVHPVATSNGELMEKRLKGLAEKIGAPEQIVSDEGSDLSKGVRGFLETQPQVVYTHDVTHWLACIVKRVLEADARWSEFRTECGKTRQRLQQTSGSFLSPPAERSKGRFLNIAPYVEWGTKTLARLSRSSGSAWSECLGLPEEEARGWVEERLGWVVGFAPELSAWQRIVTVVETTEEVVKNNGLGRTSESEVRERLGERGLLEDAEPRVSQVRTAALERLSEEGNKIPEGKKYLGSSDVLESVFGKYKEQTKRSVFGEIGLYVLLIPLLVVRLSYALIDRALASVSWKQVQTWQEENLDKSRLKKGRLLDGKESDAESRVEEVERGPPRMLSQSSESKGTTEQPPQESGAKGAA